MNPTQTRSHGLWLGTLRSLCLSLALLGVGCRALPTMPPVDLAEAGWHVRTGQFVWRPPGRHSPGLAGELLVARHPDGRSFLQFSKDPLQLVVAQTTREFWRIDFGFRQRSFGGRGNPSPRLVWFQLGHAENLASLPPAWRAEYRADGEIRLANESTGELLEGYLSP